MGKRERRTFMEEYKQEAVRLTETSGRTIAQVADDLGIRLSTLTRWKRRYREADLLAGPHEHPAWNHIDTGHFDQVGHRPVV